jgi:type IV secretion system protein VirB4
MPGAADIMRSRSGGAPAQPTQVKPGSKAGLWSALRPMFWKQSEQENPVSAFVSAAAPVGEFDVVTRGGDYFRMYRMSGLVFEGAEASRIEEQHRALSSFVKNLPAGRTAIYLHRIHRFVEDRLDEPRMLSSASAEVEDEAEQSSSTFFAANFASQYQDRLAQTPLLATDLYLTLLVRPEPQGPSNRPAPKSNSAGAADAASLNTRQALRQRTLKELDELASLAQRSLRGFGLQPLGIREEDGVAYWEAGELLSWLINGQPRKVRLPRGPAWQSLPDARLGFGGDTLEIRHLHSRRYAKLLSLKRLQRHVEPGTLGALLYEPSEFIETQVWTPAPKRQAQAALTLQRDQLLASEDAARSEIEELDSARDLLAAGELNMGEYSYTLAVFGDSVDSASRAAARCAAALIETTDLELASVDLVSDAAWFSQQPGNLSWRPRKASISNRAFAALACGHNFSHGKRDGNPWGQAIALLRATSGAPYYFSFHASPQDADSTGQRLPGNTLLVGATGSGKTTLLGSLLTLSAKLSPRPRIISFSLDRDTEILIRALGGQFHRISYGRPTGLNPFQAKPSSERKGLWSRLVVRCIQNSQLPLLPDDEEAIARAIDAVALLEAPLRSMSTIRQNLPRTGANSLYDRLGRWCNGGELGWVFDEGGADLQALQAHQAEPDADQCTQNHRQPQALGFDYTELLDAPDVRVPVLMVLLQRMEEMLNGEPLIYHVAEAWKALNDPVFAHFLKQQQKTIRKKNGLGIFDTQQVEDLLGTDNGRVMVEQSPTKLLLANPDATRGDYVDGLGLTDTEFDLFKQVAARNNRRFVVKQGEDFVPCELDLAGMDDALAVLSATPDNLRRMDEARRAATEQFGEGAQDQPEHWLPLYLQRVRAATGRSSALAASAAQDSNRV